MNTTVCLVGCLGGLITWLILFPLRAYLERSRILDLPNERSSHRRPTPRGGGLVIVAVVLAGAALFGFLAPGFPWAALTTYALASSLIATVSWVDDIRSVPARVRFGVQSLAAVLAMLHFGFWDALTIPGVGEIRLGWFGLAVTFVWIAGLTNAYNFMDGIDGIAGSQAVVAGLGWAFLGWWSGMPCLCVLALLAAASSLGFLMHNWSPARIFMGDVGSAFLGFTFAVLPLMMKSFSHDAAVCGRAFPIGVLMLWPFVFDTAFTLARRLWMGHNIFAAHRMHLYQKLVAQGINHRAVTLFYSAASLVGVMFAVGWSLEVPAYAAFVPAILLVGLLRWAISVVRERREALTLEPVMRTEKSRHAA